MHLTLKHLIGKQVIIQTTAAKYSIRGTITQLYKDGKQWVVKVQAYEDHYGQILGSGRLTSHWIPTKAITAVEAMLDPQKHHIVKLDNQGNPLPLEEAKETQVQPELPKVEQPKPKEPALPIAQYVWTNFTTANANWL